MFELKPYNRGKRQKRFEFSSWIIQRLFLIAQSCASPQCDSAAGLDDFPAARGSACSAVLLSACLGGFESTLTNLQWFLWPQTLCQSISLSSRGLPASSHRELILPAAGTCLLQVPHLHSQSCVCAGEVCGGRCSWGKAVPLYSIARAYVMCLSLTNDPACGCADVIYGVLCQIYQKICNISIYHVVFLGEFAPVFREVNSRLYFFNCLYQWGKRKRAR